MCRLENIAEEIVLVEVVCWRGCEGGYGEEILREKNFLT